MPYLKGKLPHRPFRGTPMHIVYRLHGSLAISEIERLKQERERLRKEYGESLTGRATAEEAFEGVLDDTLHTTLNGPYYLARPAFAQLVLDSWKYVARQYGIFICAVCVMSNHVHVVARSVSGEAVDPGLVMGRHKSFTGSEANKLLGASGQAFWAVSYFDRDVRPGTFETVMWYVLNNPVKSKLALHWEQWEWTYLNPVYDAQYRWSTDW